MVRRMLIGVIVLLSGLAQADGPRLPRERNRAWQDECGSCHVAYPPSLLSAQDWHALMQGLDKHFGANAALDAKTAAEIGAYLERNASTRGARNASATLRITDTSWFVREHRELSPQVWCAPQVKSAANCGACHRGAERGLYGEDDVVIPTPNGGTC